MLYSKYEKILTKGKKIKWYSFEVPKELITLQVEAMALSIKEQIDKYESVDSDKKKDYICKLWENIESLPYRLNGDFYLIKKKEIEVKNKNK